MADRRTALPALAAAAALAVALPAAGQTWRTVSSSRQLAGERELAVQVEYGAGRLKVEPAAAGLLYRFELRYDEERSRPVTEYDRAGGRLRLGLDNVRNRSLRGRQSGRADVALSPEVPLTLDLAFGAGEADVELGGLSLQRVELSTGASDSEIRFSAPNRIEADEVRVEAGAAHLEVMGLGNSRARRFAFEGGLGDATLDFSGAWTRSAEVSVEMGMGSVTLRIPRSLGVRVEKDSFLASFDAPGMVRRDGAWFTRNWDDARHRLTISIDAAIGSIDIDWID
ncbi:MAG TPA: LiaF domain-containing protein [Longimicrobiaceae bacterium]|nr:LiaF domain-containing protein [Longimicrobiaceae bacterium]